VTSRHWLAAGKGVFASPRTAWHFHLSGCSVAEFFCNDLYVVLDFAPAGALHVRTAGLDLKTLGDFATWQLRPISSDRLNT
jgi:hypothetical protein